MPRAHTKDDLIVAANDQYQKLTDLISSLTEKELSTEFDFSDDPKKTERHWSRDKNLRDIYIHLYEWHQLLLNWIAANDNTPVNSGEKSGQPFIPEPYSWKTYGDMNVALWEKHQKTSLTDARKLFETSHQAVLKLLDNYSNEQLFSRGVYPWVNTELGSYFVSVRPSHYDWAIKKLKAHRKKCQKSKLKRRRPKGQRQSAEY